MESFIFASSRDSYYSTPCKRSRHIYVEKPQIHHAAIRPNFWPGGGSTPDKKISLLALIILVLTIYWLLSFFGQSIVPGISHTSGFVDGLSVIIVVLIIIRFLA